MILEGKMRRGWSWNEFLFVFEDGKKEMKLYPDKKTVKMFEDLFAEAEVIDKRWRKFEMGIGGPKSSLSKILEKDLLVLDIKKDKNDNITWKSNPTKKRGRPRKQLSVTKDETK